MRFGYTLIYYVHSKLAFFTFCIQNSKLLNGECTFNFVDNRKQNTPDMSQNAFCPQIIHFINVICILCYM